MLAVLQTFSRVIYYTAVYLPHSSPTRRFCMQAIHRASPMSTFANLRDWCCERGAEWSPTLEVRDGERGRGVFATAPIKEGELLLRLPASLIIQPSGPIAKLVANGECSKLLGLALTHMHESRVAEPRAPYFADLASQPPPNVPLRWKEVRPERTVLAAGKAGVWMG